MTAAPRGETREQFEAWAATRPLYLGRVRQSDDYCEGHAADAWAAWQAARALASPVAPGVRALVDAQAEDEALWVVPPRTVTEDALQRALRTLHEAVEASPIAPPPSPVVAQAVVAGEAGAVVACAVVAPDGRRYMTDHTDPAACDKAWNEEGGGPGGPYRVVPLYEHPATPLRPRRGEADQAFYEAALAFGKARAAFKVATASSVMNPREYELRESAHYAAREDFYEAYESLANALRPAPGANKEESK